MKTLVIFYSYTGKTKAMATKIAKETGADIQEVKEVNKRGKFNAYFFGSLEARGRKKPKIEPISIDLNAYEKIIFLMPIWAGFPAPALNCMIDILPKGKEVELLMTSGSGQLNASAEETKALIASKGCTVTKYTTTKG